MLLEKNKEAPGTFISRLFQIKSIAAVTSLEIVKSLLEYSSMKLVLLYLATIMHMKSYRIGNFVLKVVPYRNNKQMT